LTTIFDIFEEGDSIWNGTQEIFFRNVNGFPENCMEITLT
jgi:hypothetical protein